MDVIESPERRRFRRRSVVLTAGAAVLLAIAGGAVALRHDKPKQPTLPGWPAAGARAGDGNLRATAWRAWADRDPSVLIDRTAMVFAENWRQGERTVVLLATQDTGGTRIAVVLVNGKQAARFSTRRLDNDTRFITELVEVSGHSAVLAVAPGMKSVAVTTATPGAPRAEEADAAAVGGVLVPIAAGRTATRVILKGAGDTTIADRVPGADSSPQTPPAPLIVREFMEGERRVQIRTDGGSVTCQVVLADPENEAPTLVECPPAT